MACVFAVWLVIHHLTDPGGTLEKHMCSPTQTSAASSEVSEGLGKVALSMNTGKILNETTLERFIICKCTLGFPGQCS